MKLVDISDRETVFPIDGESSVFVARGMRAGDHDQVFTSEKGGSFNVNVAGRWAREYLPPINVTIDVFDTLRGLAVNIDLDLQRLMQLAERDFDEVLAETVLLYVLMPDGTHLLIDGNHRLAFLCMCRQRAGFAELNARAYIIPHQLAEQFKVHYFERYADGREREISAEELLVRISGIYSSPGGDIRTDPQKRAQS